MMGNNLFKLQQMGSELIFISRLLFYEKYKVGSTSINGRKNGYYLITKNRYPTILCILLKRVELCGIIKKEHVKNTSYII